jgi:hypothetical protein
LSMMAQKVPRAMQGDYQTTEHYSRDNPKVGKQKGEKGRDH